MCKSSAINDGSGEREREREREREIIIGAIDSLHPFALLPPALAVRKLPFIKLTRCQVMH